jgi:hypothetical protein
MRFPFALAAIAFAVDLDIAVAAAVKALAIPHASNTLRITQYHRGTTSNPGRMLRQSRKRYDHRDHNNPLGLHGEILMLIGNSLTRIMRDFETIASSRPPSIFKVL